MLLNAIYVHYETLVNEFGNVLCNGFVRLSDFIPKSDISAFLQDFRSCMVYFDSVTRLPCFSVPEHSGIPSYHATYRHSVFISDARTKEIIYMPANDKKFSRRTDWVRLNLYYQDEDGKIQCIGSYFDYKKLCGASQQVEDCLRYLWYSTKRLLNTFKPNIQLSGLPVFWSAGGHLCLDVCDVVPSNVLYIPNGVQYAFVETFWAMTHLPDETLYVQLPTSFSGVCLKHGIDSNIQPKNWVISWTPSVRWTSDITPRIVDGFYPLYAGSSEIRVISDSSILADIQSNNIKLNYDMRRLLVLRNVAGHIKCKDLDMSDSICGSYMDAPDGLCGATVSRASEMFSKVLAMGTVYPPRDLGLQQDWFNVFTGLMAETLDLSNIPLHEDLHLWHDNRSTPFFSCWVGNLILNIAELAKVKQFINATSPLDWLLMNIRPMVFQTRICVVFRQANGYEDLIAQLEKQLSSSMRKLLYFQISKGDES